MSQNHLRKLSHTVSDSLKNQMKQKLYKQILSPPHPLLSVLIDNRQKDLIVSLVITSVANPWLAPFDSRYLTHPSWFSWAAMYSGVKPFCDCTLIEAPFCTRSLTTSSWPAVKLQEQMQLYRNRDEGGD